MIQHTIEQVDVWGLVGICTACQRSSSLYECNTRTLGGSSLRQRSRVIDRKQFWHVWPRWHWLCTQWLQKEWVPLLLRVDVWSKFEEGRSRCYWSETV